MNLLFHKQTKSNLDNFIASPSHALLIVGAAGSGKGTTAGYVASKIIGASIDKLADHPYAIWLKDLEKGIAIEDVRVATKFVQLKTPGSNNIRRVIILENAQTMGHEAQNALLKLLEEPPADTLLILTATSNEAILPTILSRVQKIQILPPSLKQVENYFEGQYSANEITKSYYISEGYMGLMNALLSADQNHPLVAQIANAKTLLSGSAFDRLIKVDEIAKAKDTSLLLQAMERVCHAAMTQSAKTGSASTERWARRLRSVLEASDNLQAKAQAKLVLTKLMLDL